MHRWRLRLRKSRGSLESSMYRKALGFSHCHSKRLAMSKLSEAIQALTSPLETPVERDRNNVERRMRETEGRATALANGLRLGLVLN